MFLSGCKVELTAFEAPDTAQTESVITASITGKVTETSDNSMPVYGIILQIPQTWDVASVRVMPDADTEIEVREDTKYSSLYKAESGQKIWMGTVIRPETEVEGSYDVSPEIKLLTGTSEGNFSVKLATGSLKKEEWATDDPSGEFDFSNITGDKYVESIVVTNNVCDVNGDGKIGLEEAVHALRVVTDLAK